MFKVDSPKRQVSRNIKWLPTDEDDTIAAVSSRALSHASIFWVFLFEHEYSPIFLNFIGSASQAGFITRADNRKHVVVAYNANNFC